MPMRLQWPRLPRHTRSSWTQLQLLTELHHTATPERSDLAQLSNWMNSLFHESLGSLPSYLGQQSSTLQNTETFPGSIPSTPRVEEVEDTNQPVTSKMLPSRAVYHVDA